ncbi:hypothetical protein CONLIGDRAFT_148050 [Coniochaeta ligniaria NRRL 30616]|uniref:Uncharacterized protein n=1 Tax=Coniochaeta ligniaria NRRL 30616 TaxID=1408157 RepID=A0A1J7I532_9PEZI|nr:hypothetical protein CONLIGDRAFT_148050 [Coniochaeta ligniaria NRRL 30616]
MAPAQRTFTIVPNPLGMQGLVQRPAGEGVPSHRPMTSKQAQKLHRQATKLPKRTKAEQALYEKEQKRIIKEEDEKRRASNKARMLRERKKEKEQKIIDAKKRKGLPVVDVRPSQDLITRFVRGNGTGKKRDVSGAPVRLDTLREESPACDSATETAADEDVYNPVEEEADESDNTVEAPEARAEPSSNPAKRPRTHSLSDTEKPSAVPSPRRSQKASRTVVSALRMLAATSRESSLDVDDPAVEDLLRTQILEESISAANSSAIQQRSPVWNMGIASIPDVSPDKENIAPVPMAVNTSEGSVKKSPPKLAHGRPSIHHNSRPAATAAAQKAGAGNSQLRGSANSQVSPKALISSKSPARNPLLKSPHARSPVHRQPRQDNPKGIRKPSSYETDLIEGTRCRTSVSPAAAHTLKGVHEHVRQECPQPCASRMPLVPTGPSGEGASTRPQPHTSREPRPLRETNSNIREPARNGSQAFVAMKPPAPVKSVSNIPPVSVKHSMPPPPPSSSRFRKPFQESNRPKFLPKHLQTPVPHPPPVSTEHQPTPALPSESVLPTSTQLFVLSHLEDILPSPSQELRELDETAPRRPPISKPRPPLWKPPPRFPARGVQTVHRPNPPPLPQLKAPRPRQPTTAAPRVHQIQQTIEPALPFFSTQDFTLSSQDIRDLEESTETPSKLPRKETHTETSRTATIPRWNETPSKAEQYPADAFIYPWKRKLAGDGRTEAAVQQPSANKELRDCVQTSHASRYALRKSQPRTPMCSSNLSATASQPPKPQSQSSSLNPVRSNPSLAHVAAAGQRSQSSPRAQSFNTQVAEPASQNLASPKPPTSARKGQLSPASSRRSLQVSDNLQMDQERPHMARGSPKPKTPKPSASPQKGRFFTASNEAIQLAMEKSMRTHKEELRKREAEQRALELLRQEIAEDEAEKRALELQQALELLRGGIAEDEACHTEEEDAGDGEEDESDEEKDEVTRWFEMIEKKLRKQEAEEYERDVLADWNAEHQYDADRQASQDARDAADEKAFDLDDDVEEELLATGYALLEVHPPAPVPSEHGTCGLVREQTTCVASQETDYGDLDVTVEDLDDYL